MIRASDTHTTLGFFAFSLSILFVVFPGLIILGNTEEILHPARYYLYFVALAISLFALTWALSLVARLSLLRTAAAVVAAYAVTAYFTDLLFPLGIGPIETGMERASTQTLPALVQIVTFVGSVFLLYWTSAREGDRFCWTAAAVAMVFSFGSSVPLLVDSLPSAERKGEQASSPASPTAGPRSNRNVYHIILDAYYGPWLRYSLNELKLPDEALGGFTHYPNAKSNYWYTRMSFPSFLSGTTYSPQLGILEWRRRADADSLISDLNTLGYETTVYAIRNRHGFGQATHFIEARTGGADFPLLLDYWALRTVPIALRRYVLADGHGPFSRLSSAVATVPRGDVRTYTSYRQFRQFLADEERRPARGQYVLIHAYPPHGPYQLDRTGTYIGKSSYVEQLHLATNMITDVVARLKALDRFDDSLIIVHSDHGSTVAAQDRYKQDQDMTFLRMDDGMSEVIKQIDVQGQSGQQVEAKYSALLLVKPPVECASMRSTLASVEVLTELRQLRAYTNHVIAKPEAGCAYPEVTHVDMYHGLAVQKDKQGRSLVVGRDIMSGTANHYRVVSSLSWEVMEALPFRYE